MSAALPRAPARVVIRRARVFDSVAATMRGPCTVVVEHGRIAAVDEGELAVDDAALEIDAAGGALLPGLIDAHVHVVASSHDLAGLERQPASLLAARASAILRGMLDRGFTTVRDAAGADAGLREALDSGLFEGPRLLVAGRAISQTGGHADLRGRGANGGAWTCGCAGIGLAGAIADGVGEVRRAVREQVRLGADHIKLMAGGGVSSPSDPLEGTQFAVDELAAAVEEAEAANLYALAHAYSPRAVSRAVRAGVRSIEHGNLIDEATARLMRTHGTFLVPTLSTYAALADEGERLGWDDAMRAKLERVAGQGLDAVRLALGEGVAVVFGTDLLGHMHDRQSGEFAIRAPLQPPLQLLQSATHTAARLLRREREIGVVAVGAHADLLLVDGDPAAGLGMLAEPARGIRLVMQRGRVVRDRRTLAPGG